jgi:hypothetical protein
MPPSNATQVTDGDGDAGRGDAEAGTGDAEATNPRQTLLDWLTCGALNN